MSDDAPFSSLFDRSLLWLGAAVPLLVLASGKGTIPVAAWLAPILLLRFVREQPVVRGSLLAATVFAVVYCVTWRGMIPFSGLPFYATSLGLGLVAALPYVIDRVLAPRLSLSVATFVFPTAVVAIEYVSSFGPFGTWGSAAYTQQSLALLQLTSVTGIWGITFLIHWTASVVNAAWEEGLAGSGIRRVGGLWAGVLVAVLLFGGARLAFTGSSDTVPVATVTGNHTAPTFWAVRRRAPSRAAVRDSARAVQRDYLARARRAAQAGARLVSWPEAAVPVPIEDTTAFLDRARAVATQEEVYLAVAVNVFPRPDSEKRLQNTVIWMDPEGTVRTKARKTHLVPGEPGQPGTGQLPTIETPHGAWTSAVCYDMDFPSLIRQAGRQDVDLLVAPSNDWRAIGPQHAHMARVRAIENGTSLLRPTSNGHTFATDPLGRVRARMDHFTTDRRLQTAHLPTESVSTAYSILGGVFAWGCLGGLLVLVGVGVWASPTRPSESIGSVSA
jgi:apolipoprotein N-acyltransferase